MTTNLIRMMMVIRLIRIMRMIVIAMIGIILLKHHQQQKKMNKTDYTVKGNIVIKIVLH